MVLNHSRLSIISGCETYEIMDATGKADHDCKSTVNCRWKCQADNISVLVASCKLSMHQIVLITNL